MLATPGGEYIVLLAGNGVAYLYDALSDEYVLSQQVASTPIQGYYGTIAAGPGGQYFVVNGTVLNRSLVPPAASGGGFAPGPTTTASRPISALYAVNSNTLARFVQPTRSSTTAAVTTTPTVEIVDVTTGMARASAAALEGPLSTQIGTQRANVSARTMAVDASGSTAYLLTTSGLSIVPLASQGGPGVPPAAQQRPQVNPSGIVNTANYQATFAPGSVVSIFGQNLASSASSSTTPLPAVMGGSCVTIDNAAVPLLMTSPEQINVQLPFDLTAARHSVIVRSIDKSTTTAAQTITVAKYAPAVFVNTQTGQAEIYHDNGTLVTKDSPATRDQSLSIYASGLGVTTGGKVTAGSLSPADPPAVTQPIKVYLGNPSYKQAEVIVEWSGLVPGTIGIYQIKVRVPGEHMKGDALPVILRIGGVDSPKTGTGAAVIAVE
jgi:uncharacterized protein (TIGR03437 family)